MDIKDEKYLILEQYRIYSDAKEKFIERQFTTNRFYLVLNLIILVVSYVLSTLTPQYQPTIVLAIIGFAVTIMWWMNIDSYQMLIKVKYAKVLEYYSYDSYVVNASASMRIGVCTPFFFPKIILLY